MKYRHRIFSEANGNIVINCAKPHYEFLFFTHAQKLALVKKKRQEKVERSVLQSPGNSGGDKQFNFNG